MNTYAEVIDYLYNRLPMFTRDGSSAYKEDLDRTLTLCASLGNPQHKFKSIHVAGTNGKGSSSHMLAAIFAQAGYKTGLYTSPHLLDFRERIRINGEKVDEQFVVDYVNAQKDLIEDIQPSFFEVTVALAFDYFAQEQVDIAIVEVGLGGRLDSTNVIQPEVSLITNIGMDHMNLLGDTIAEIAAEKAGIIKYQTPVVISESSPLTTPVFIEKAHKEYANIVFADQVIDVNLLKKDRYFQFVSVNDSGVDHREYALDLMGSYQLKNIAGVLTVIHQMQRLGFSIDEQHISFALSHVQQLTGLQGRWQTLSTLPLVICDTGHNEDGIKEVVENLKKVNYQQLHFVIGAMQDKDLDHMLLYLPKDAIYYFSNPNMPRAMKALELAKKAELYGLNGIVVGSVDKAFEAAKASYHDNDLIFVGGSNFVVAEVLSHYNKK